MTRNYCTLFDRNYLAFGLALYRSLKKNAGPFRLFVLAMDESCERALQTLALEDAVIIPLRKVITPQYSFVYQQMTFGQICWTCQPLLCKCVLDEYGVDAVTYLEADSYFFGDPEALFAEIGERSVSLVPHNYAPGYDQTSTSGIYCVQFNMFRNDAHARQLLQEWESECLKYDRNRSRYFPGQVCLNDWASRSSAVHVVRHKGAGVAPWNQALFKVSVRGGRPTVDDVPVIFYHFHELSFIDENNYFISSYEIQPETIRNICLPYVEELRDVRRTLQSAFPGFNHFKDFRSPGLGRAVFSMQTAAMRSYLKYLYCYYRGRRNIVRLN